MTGPLATVAAVAGVGAAVAAGFKVRPRPVPPVGFTVDRGSVRLPADLPPLLARHLDPDGDGQVPRMDTMALWARPWMRVGRSPWLPLRMRTLHRVGRDFASDISLTWYGLTVVDVVDAYVGGHGIAGPARRPEVGAEIDQGANLFLWCEAALIPSAFAVGSELRAIGEGAATVRLDVPLGDGRDTAWLHFDGDRPSRFSALRHKGLGGAKVWWHVDMRDWQPVDGIMLPGHIEVTWQDEGRPWFRLAMDGFAANIDVDARLDDVDEAIRDIRARARPAAGFDHVRQARRHSPGTRTS